MEGSNINLSALKNKIFEKLSGASEEPLKSKNSKPAKVDKKSKKESSKPSQAKSSAASKSEKEAKEQHSNHASKNPKTPNKSKKSETSSKTPKTKNTETSFGEDDILRREALSLGATEEDLKMVQNIGDGEDSKSKGNDKSLSSDVSNFILSLGIKGELNIGDEEKAKKLNSKKLTTSQKEEMKRELKEAKKQEKKLQKEARIEEKKQAKAEKEEKKKVKAEREESKASENTVQTAYIEKPKKDSGKINNVKSVNSEKLRIDARVDWFNCEVPKVEEPVKCDRFAVERLTDRAKALVDSENRIYLEEFTSNSSQKKFLSQILSDGTLNDKISALTLLVQEAPLHNLRAFDTLLGYCEKKARTAALQAINAMKDLFLNGLLPDRKLLAFNKQPLSADAKDETLALYYFEDYLKKAYFRFIQVLEHLSHDPILHVKMNVVTHIFDLLTSKPEQEANLLRLGVNKLGDIDNKIASKASYHLLQLEESHPAMKKIVTDAVTDLIFQKKNDYNAQYFTILTLNQTVFAKSDVEMANALVKTYFSMFEKILLDSDKTSGELDKLGGDKTLGKTEQGRKKKGFKKGKKGGRSVKVEEKTESEVMEEKNSKMFSALLTGLNRALPYADLPSDIYMTHLNTLYKITHSTNFNTSVQALLLVQQIVTQQDLDKDRYFRTLYESLMDPRLVNSSKQGIYLNLLFKSLKNDIQNVPRLLAFVKRMLQVCTHWINIGSIAGMFYLLMQLSQTHPQILELMEAVEARPEVTGTEVSAEEYDPKKRDPKYANAQSSCLWEISQFTNHYHPTVAIYATSLLEGTSQPKPDLGLYTLAHFLDKFVYKNAKQKPATRGSSIMQPLGGAHLGNLLVRSSNVVSEDVPANTVDWLSRRAETIRPDEKFFYDYFVNNSNKIRANKPEKFDDDDDEDEDDGESEIWDALVKLRPEIEGSDEEEDFSDFDQADFADMSGDEEDFGDIDGAVDGISDAEFDGGDAPEQDGSDDDGGLFNFSGDDEIGSDDATEALEDKKRRGGDEDDGKTKKKMKLKNLPTFASADDYAQYLQSDDDDL